MTDKMCVVFQSVIAVIIALYIMNSTQDTSVQPIGNVVDIGELVYMFTNFL